MLGQFTWGQFLCCYGAVSLLWYLGLLFTAYRKETIGFLGRSAVNTGSNGILRFKPKDKVEVVNDQGDPDIRQELSESAREPDLNQVKNKQREGEIMENDLMVRLNHHWGSKSWRLPTCLLLRLQRTIRMKKGKMVVVACEDLVGEYKGNLSDPGS
ncbi:hypothetical protein ASU31_25730 [Pedobacter ginsenosidimutans]|uniref:Uncharacterized protein n=1 Tax=Pedobacter ginsenosidimutans TaxID=687842 RepID=A0A0T5VJ00_9SPHI|nr:hypothetical protein [Pedobacter ginsenosidimutans]KRT13205.1 hypothetical protein ASU31_25730 [Pedobacter ginsenosidimutans]